MNDSSIVLTQAAIVERRREVFGSAARPLVHPDDIESGTICFRGDTTHIVRLAAAFKAMHEDHGPACRAVGLPVAEAEQLGMRLGGEKPRLGRYSGQQPLAWPTEWKQGHDMWIAEPRGRSKISPVW